MQIMKTTTDPSKYIKKSHLKALEKFKAELEAFRQETGEEVATLYEDAFTSFTLSDIEVRGDRVYYMYDGRQESDLIVLLDEETMEYYEDDLFGLMDTIKFWKKCLRRARRYWQMDTATLDAIQDGEREDKEEEEEE